jgi:hypothetical protein
MLRIRANVTAGGSVPPPPPSNTLADYCAGNIPQLENVIDPAAP